MYRFGVTVSECLPILASYFVQVVDLSRFGRIASNMSIGQPADTTIVVTADEFMEFMKKRNGEDLDKY